MGTKATEIDDRAAEWVIRLENPDHSPKERREFDSWSVTSDRHRSAFLRARKGWLDANCARFLRPVDGQVDLDVFRKFPSNGYLGDTFRRVQRTRLDDNDRRDGSWGRLASEDEEPQDDISPPRAFFAPLAFGVTLTALVMSLLLVALLQARWQTHSTQIGGFARTALPDGSSVELNTDSTIRVLYTATERRIDLVKGEALFKVRSDPDRPFKVTASGTHVRAVGTAFAMRVRGKNFLEVMVTEGRVAIGDEQIPLSAGGTASVRARHVKIATPPGHAYLGRKLAWTRGRLAFQGETLAQAVQEFNRYNSRLRLRIADPQLTTLAVGGTFVAAEPHAFVQSLAVLDIEGVPASPEASGRKRILLKRVPNVRTASWPQQAETSLLRIGDVLHGRMSHGR